MVKTLLAVASLVGGLLLAGSSTADAEHATACVTRGEFFSLPRGETLAQVEKRWHVVGAGSALAGPLGAGGIYRLFIGYHLCGYDRKRDAYVAVVYPTAGGPWMLEELVVGDHAVIRKGHRSR